MIYKYYVNLDERGEFNADVRAPDGTTVFTIESFDHLWDLIEDHWMGGRNDVDGLCEYLIDHVGVLTNEDRLVSGN